MRDILSVALFECRYPITDEPPHRLCGRPTEAFEIEEPYCPEHKALCHRGHGKDARSLEEMIYAIDKSQYRGRTGHAEHTDPVDEELRRANAKAA